MPSPPSEAQRAVEKGIDYLTQSWWRTAAVGSPEAAQASADRWCVEVADALENFADRRHSHEPGVAVTSTLAQASMTSRRAASRSDRW